jgi:putative oxidoreductase
MGHGKIFSDDQHPFLFVLLSLVFFFSGPGKWSMDELLFKMDKQ